VTAFLLKWIVLPLAVFAAGLGLGYRLTSDHYAAAQAKQLTHVVAVVQKQAAITSAVGIAAQAEHDKIVYRTQTLTKEVTVYVPAAADRQCVINAGFVKLWNASASGVSTLPDAASELDARSSGVALSDVETADIANHGAALANAAELTALQDWIRQQQTVTNSK
jgi:hypothetical protein